MNLKPHFWINSSSGKLYSFGFDPIDHMPFYHSNIEQYKQTLLRIKNLDINLFHGGHFPSFSKPRANEIIDEYISGFNTITNVTDWFESSKKINKDVFSDQDWDLAKLIISQNEN